MRASELLGTPVVDENGRALGLVRDLRLVVDDAASAGSGYAIAALVVGEPGARSAAAHAWGFAQGRSAGPALLRRLLAPAAQRSLRVPAELVLDWGPRRVRVAVSSR